MEREIFLNIVQKVVISLAVLLFIVIIFLFLLKVSQKRFLNKRFLCNYDWVCLTSQGENKFKDDKDITICEGTTVNIQNGEKGDIVGLCDNGTTGFKYGACDETNNKSSTTAFYPYFEEYFSYFDPANGAMKLNVQFTGVSNDIPNK